MLTMGIHGFSAEGYFFGELMTRFPGFHHGEQLNFPVRQLEVDVRTPETRTPDSPKDRRLSLRYPIQTNDPDRGKALSRPPESEFIATRWLAFRSAQVPGRQYPLLARKARRHFTASLDYLFRSFAPSIFADYPMGMKARQWARKTTTNLDQILLGLVRSL